MGSKKGTDFVLVSACLVGIKCRHNGKACINKKVISLIKKGKAISVCPEQLGGLPTPRPAVELVKGKALDKKGNNFTVQFNKGAQKVLAIAKLIGCKKAILKAKSPSCGNGLIYDGTFSGKLKKGDGILTSMLKKQGIKVESL